MNEIGQTVREAALSPYRRFTRGEWARLRADTPLTLTVDDLTKLQSINDPISVEEVIAIYLPLSRLLALYVAATQGLFKATQRFLGAEDGGKMPYIIGIAGSVAVGKSTTARVLQALLSRWPNTPKVDLVTTDGFLLPNAVLEREGLMDKKGFYTFPPVDTPLKGAENYAAWALSMQYNLKAFGVWGYVQDKIKCPSESFASLTPTGDSASISTGDSAPTTYSDRLTAKK